MRRTVRVKSRVNNEDTRPLHYVNTKEQGGSVTFFLVSLWMTVNRLNTESSLTTVYLGYNMLALDMNNSQM